MEEIVGNFFDNYEDGFLEYLEAHKTQALKDRKDYQELNKNSGMLGISGISSDFRDIDAKIAEKHSRSIMAHYLYVNSIVGYIAKYYVELGGVDAICFTAGVGENAPHVRRMIMDRLACLGIKVDRAKNDEIRFGKEGIISAEDSSVPCYVIPTNEEVMIARDTYSFI